MLRDSTERFDLKAAGEADGWTNGWINGWMDGRMKGWTDGQLMDADGQMHNWTNVNKDSQTSTAPSKKKTNICALKKS